MNTTDSGYRQNPPGNSQRNIVIVVVLACIVVFLALLGFGAVALFKSAMSSSSGITAVSGGFISKIQSHNCSAAYAMITPAGKSVVKQGDLKDMETMMENRDGAPVSYSMQQFNVQDFNGVTTAHVTYLLYFKNGRYALAIDLAQTPAGYRIQDYSFSLQ